MIAKKTTTKLENVGMATLHESETRNETTEMI